MMMSGGGKILVSVLVPLLSASIRTLSIRIIIAFIVLCSTEIRYSGKQRQGREVAFNDRLGIDAQPILDHCSIHRAEVGAKFQVAVVEVGQAGLLTVDAALD